ncbi:MAG: hypothetical protein CMF48_00740 [Legionellales bacterium]|nr:hypothetical protein [Legionellales bacterium]|tara:strand:- start:230 stop:508 length:279 start_codon:yes stop_codon:yes gene_type:complete
MLIVLAILNCLAFAFMIFALQNLTTGYRKIFLGSAACPLIGAVLVSLVTEHTILPFHDAMAILGFLFRGWFITCIASGAAGCYIATHVKASK